MFPERVIVDDSLRSVSGDVTVEVRIPWYRALPLSCVGRIEVSVDGVEIDRQALSFEIDGVSRRLDDLADEYDTWWFVLDSAFIHIDRDAVPALDGDQVAVTVVLGLIIPYLPVAGEPLRIAETCTKALSLRRLPA